MSGREIRDMAASVKSRLLAIARQRGESFDLTLTTYARERLLYRMSHSPHKDRFVLKGATLFSIWTDQPHRPTRDIDLLGWGDSAVPEVERAFREMCDCHVEEDGIRFLTETVRGEENREEQEYGGVRISLDALLGQARIPVRVDIGFGDAVTPEPEELAFPTLLDFPAPVLRSYPRETFVAEKLQAMVALGIANSRMKDFYDLWFLARAFGFDGETLSRAITATFNRRQTPIPLEAPLALSAEFHGDDTKQVQWRAFVERGKLAAGEPRLDGIVEELRGFLLPPMRAAAKGGRWDAEWIPSGPWRTTRT